MMSTPKLVVMHPTVGSYRRPPGCALHLTHVEKKVAEAVRPDPVALDDALLEENIGEPPSQALSIEILFTAVGSLPGLRGCARLQELTLMHARLTRVPPELQSVRHTLQRLSLANNEIGRIEHLGGMVHLHTLFLQENSLEVIDGLGDCVALQRLWLSANKIGALGDGLRPLHELRELWLQANPLQSAHELGALASLQVLSLAATEIASVDALEPLRGLRSLYDLSFDDLMFGAAPLADLPDYREAVLHTLQQVQLLDGTAVAERERAAADEAYLQRALSFHQTVEQLKGAHDESVALLERERQASAAKLRAMRTAHGRAFAELRTAVERGLAATADEEAAFVAAHDASLATLRGALEQLRARHAAEEERLTSLHRARAAAHRRRARRLARRHHAAAELRARVSDLLLQSDGRLATDAVPRADADAAFVRARVETGGAPPTAVTDDGDGPISAPPRRRMVFCDRVYVAAADPTPPGAKAAAAGADGGRVELVVVRGATPAD